MDNKPPLKTLKDIDSTRIARYGRAVLFVNEEELRAEAILWIKHFRGDAVTSTYGNLHAIIVEWIIKFFNLTEEDIGK